MSLGCSEHAHFDERRVEVKVRPDRAQLRFEEVRRLPVQIAEWIGEAMLEKRLR